MKKIEVRNKILLFDLDGTLVDTEKLGEAVLRHYCIDRGWVNQEEMIHSISRLIVGRTWKAAVKEIVEQYPLMFDSDEVEKDLKALYLRLLHQGVELIPGVFEKLTEMRKTAAFMGIVTGSGKQEVDHILKEQGLNQLFDRVWSSECYPESKPSPSPFLTAYAEIQEKMRSASGRELIPQDVLIFEDSNAGMDSASAANFPFIQILYAHPHMKVDSRCWFAVQDWNELQIES